MIILFKKLLVLVKNNNVYYNYRFENGEINNWVNPLVIYINLISEDRYRCLLFCTKFCNVRIVHLFNIVDWIQF